MRTEANTLIRLAFTVGLGYPALVMSLQFRILISLILLLESICHIITSVTLKI